MYINDQSVQLALNAPLQATIKVSHEGGGGAALQEAAYLSIVIQTADEGRVVGLRGDSAGNFAP